MISDSSTVVRPCFYGPCKHFFCGDCIDMLEECCSVCGTLLEGFVENERVNNIIQQLEELNKLYSNEDHQPLKSSTIAKDLPRDVKVSPAVDSSRIVCSIKSEKKNGKGETPLHVATNSGDFDKVNALIEHGANVNTKDNAGWTPLHEAGLRGFREIMILLLEKGAYIDEPAQNDFTALHDAVVNDCIDTVKILVFRGADIYARTDSGKTALDLAAKKPKILEILQKAISDPFGEMSLVKKKISFVTTGLNEEQNKEVIKCAKMLSAFVSPAIDKSTTHLIAKCNKESNCPRTMKYMHAVARGKWIVKLDWIYACMKAGKVIDERLYEVEGCGTHPNNYAPRKARQHAENKLTRLFDSCSFFFLGEFADPARNELTQLSEACGATVLKRTPTLSTAHTIAFSPFCGTIDESLTKCSHYIFFHKTEPVIKYDDAKLKTLHVKFLLNSISKFELKLENVD
uniref:BRCT domain-containing protein n=1 Tax=Strigamia maritima TaxID=126957 RepID=T1JHF0_STRMM